MSYKFTTKQKKFIAAYDGNASEAARKAGYSKKTAPFIGAENLKKPQIAAAIAQRQGKKEVKLIANRETRQRFWSESMRGVMQPGQDGRPVRLQAQDRLRASELLGKSEGDFLDRVEHSGNIKIEIVKYD